MPARISWTSTTRAPARRCRTCGCWCPGTGALIEPLRTLRLIHYSAWLARRWDDPAFPHAFPWFGSSDYWRGQVQMLEEQMEAMEEAAVVV
ncbi:MAG: hypothetical protein K0S57_1439 [Ramlibacter sp.]|nr:hypothetical protein [Ramlibacter sp.]